MFIRIFMISNHLDMNRGYPTNLTVNQWQILQKNMEPTTRKRNYSLRDIMDSLREKLRIALGREESPSLGIIDSRSAKTSQHVGKERGIDGNKKVKGRKEQVVVDTLGFPMAVSGHEASIHDSKGAESALERLAHKFPRLKKFQVWLLAISLVATGQIAHNNYQPEIAIGVWQGHPLTTSKCSALTHFVSLKCYAFGETNL